MSNPLPPDSPDGFESDVAVMRRDAQNWQEASDRLGQAACVAQGLHLDDAKFSLIGSQAGVISAYNDFRSWVVGLMNEGKATFASMCDALNASAQAYEQDDDAAAGSMNQINSEGG